ncbi:MAG: hypothetical protein IPJ74_09400 [Saprospiraceae bacterium]|nr:hypothetical protein [Saprospiraceae bacterium]
MYNSKVNFLRAQYQENNARLLTIEQKIKTTVETKRTNLVSEQLKLLLSQLQVSEDLVNELRHQQSEDAKLVES